MPYNGSGTFTLVAGNPVITGTTISSTVQNNTTADFAAGLSNAICRDGQTTVLANIPMANFKFTSLGNGAANTDSVNFGQVFNSPAFNTPTVVADPAVGDVSSLIPSTRWCMTMQSPNFSGTPTAPTAAPGNSSTQIATTAFAAALAFSAALPAISSATAGQVVTNNGSVGAWAPIPAVSLYASQNLGGL